MDVKGRVVLISGASSGLGEHFARLFVRSGASVVLAARRVERLQALVAELHATGGQALAVAMDVTNETSIIEAFDTGQAHFGLIDTIVANAGTSAAGRATEVKLDALHNLVDTNFTGAYLTAREGAKRLIAGGSKASSKGRIILLGSITSHLTGEGDSAYAALKAGLAHLGRNLAREWIRQGVNVNTIQPGYIQTEIAGDWFQTEGGRAQIASFPRRRLQPIGSLDAMMLYFASDASASTTGAVIDVDDGQSL